MILTLLRAVHQPHSTVQPSCDQPLAIANFVTCNRSSMFVIFYRDPFRFLFGGISHIHAWRKLHVGARFFSASFDHPDFYLRSAVNRGKKLLQRLPGNIGIILMALKICQIWFRKFPRGNFISTFLTRFLSDFFDELHFAIVRDYLFLIVEIVQSYE